MKDIQPKLATVFDAKSAKSHCSQLANFFSKQLMPQSVVGDREPDGPCHSKWFATF